MTSLLQDLRHGVRLALQTGRPFLAADEVPDSRVAVISDRLWRRKLQADPQVLDRPLSIQGQPYTVLGVRTQEIGIRMALGARHGDVLKMVVGRAMLLSMLGIGIGTAGALGVTRLMAGMLFATRPADPLTFAAMASTLAAVSALASCLPGRRATLVDPVIALRTE